MSPRHVLFALGVLACGNGNPSSPDGAAADARLPDGGGMRDAPDAQPDAPGTTCPRDPAPCPARCNAKGACEIDRGHGAEIRIQPGTVVMGSDPGESTDGSRGDRPEHLATLSRPFFLDRFETTTDQYRACVSAGACTEPSGGTYFMGPDWPFWDRIGLPPDNHPVNFVSWVQADAYCRWKGARLPTEAEWMLAARGPAGTSCLTAQDLAANDGRCNERLFAWGDEASERRANVKTPGANGLEPRTWRGLYTTPVGYFDGSLRNGYQTEDGSTPEGIHDLVGSLFEWTSEWYAADYYSNAPSIDPTGPAQGEERLMKSFGYDILTLLPSVTFRGSAPPTEGWQLSGFRCARDVL